MSQNGFLIMLQVMENRNESLVFLALINTSPLDAMSETDELGHEIVEKFKTGLQVEPQSLKSWISTCPESFVRDVYHGLGVSETTINSGEELGSLIEYMDETLSERTAIESFHRTIETLTPQERARILPVLFNYMVGSFDF